MVRVGAIRGALACRYGPDEESSDPASGAGYRCQLATDDSLAGELRFPCCDKSTFKARQCRLLSACAAGKFVHSCVT
jgi:hypothetical protein